MCSSKIQTLWNWFTVPKEKFKGFQMKSSNSNKTMATIFPNGISQHSNIMAVLQISSLLNGAVIDDIEFKSSTDVWFHMVTIDVRTSNIVNFTLAIIDSGTQALFVADGSSLTIEPTLITSLQPVVLEAILPFINETIDGVREMENVELEIINQNAEYFRNRLGAFVADGLVEAAGVETVNSQCSDDDTENPFSSTYTPNDLSGLDKLEKELFTK